MVDPVFSFRDDGIHARRMLQAGPPTGTEIAVNTVTAGDQKFPDIAMDGSGNFPSGTATIPDTQTSVQITINVTQDSLVEANEDFTVTLSNPPTGYLIGLTTASSTITDDDTDVPIDALPDNSLFEDQVLNFTYTFRRTGVTTGTTTANFSFGGGAVFNTDYTQSGATTFGLSADTVVFNPGETTKVVTLDPVNDNAVEGNETIILTVSSGSGYSPAAPTAQTATIVDDDVSVSVTSVAPSSVVENSGSGMTYTFTRSGGSPAMHHEQRRTIRALSPSLTMTSPL